MDDLYKIYYKEIGEHPLISREREKELSEIILNGGPRKQEAVDELVVANLRLAITIAKEYQNHGLELMDLIQEANMGLIEAVVNYDWKSGKFDVYAQFWIRKRIYEALLKYGGYFRLPQKKIPLVYRYKEFCEKFIRKYARDPTIDEFIRKCDIKEKGAKEFLEQYVGSVIAVESRKAEKGSEPEFLVDTMAMGDTTERDMDLALDMPVFNDIIYNQLVNSGLLNKMEHEFLMSHYGLSATDETCLRKKYDKTEEATRLINLRSLEKIRNSKFAETLKEFLEY